jgi:uncharacterized protein YecT (DUF1311 family)
MRSLIAPLLCGLSLLLIGCGGSNTGAPTANSGAPPPVQSPAADGWTKTVTNSAMDGQVITVTKDFSFADKQTLIRTLLTCKVKNKDLKISLESYNLGDSGSGTASPFTLAARNIPNGRVKFGVGEPMGLYFAFSLDQYSNVISSLGRRMLLQAMYAGLNNAQADEAEKSLQAHIATMIREDLAGGDVIKVLLPMTLEVSNQHGTVELTIPENNASINELINACAKQEDLEAHKKLDAATAALAELHGTAPATNTAMTTAEAIPSSSSPSGSAGPEAKPAIAESPVAAPTAPTASTSRVSPSFDCAKATTAIENMICNSDELSRLDSQLGSAYGARRNGISDPNALKRQQQDWVRVRNQCTDANCLTAAYQNRLQELQ